MHLTGSVDFLLRLLRSEESIVDHEVVHLRNFLCQRVMFSQEGEKFFARPVDCHLLWQEIFILQHVFEENLAQTTSLSWLMNIKVQDTWCVDMASLAELIKNVEGFAADFKETNNEATERKEKNRRKLVFSCFHPNNTFISFFHCFIWLFSTVARNQNQRKYQK